MISSETRQETRARRWITVIAMALVIWAFIDRTGKKVQTAQVSQPNSPITVHNVKQVPTQPIEQTTEKAPAQIQHTSYRPRGGRLNPRVKVPLGSMSQLRPRENKFSPMFDVSAENYERGEIVSSLVGQAKPSHHLSAWIAPYSFPEPGNIRRL